MENLGAHRRRRRPWHLPFEGEGPLLILTNPLEVLVHPGLGGRPQWGIGSGIKPVLIHHSVEHAAAQTLRARIGVITGGGHRAKNAFKQIPRLLLHGGGHGAIRIEAVHIPTHTATAEERTAHERRHHPRR